MKKKILQTPEDSLELFRNWKKLWCATAYF